MIVMNHYLKYSILLPAVMFNVSAMAFDAPVYYENKCVSCHSIGGGDEVGPDLKGVTEKRPEKWLIDFIRDSEKVIKSGDPIANELFAKFKNKKMPAQDLSDDEIKLLLEFIKTGKGPGGAAAFKSALEANPYDIEMGKSLFTGVKQFEKGGPSCLSCHGAGDNIPYLGGGSLGPDLVTTSYSAYLDKGLNKVLTKISFPTMAELYSKSPLSEQENYYLRAFLLSENTKYEQIKNESHPNGTSQNKFLLLGGLGASLGLLGLDSVWRKRRKKTKKPY